MFADRTDAGRRLARRLEYLRGRGDAVVLGLPRGGVVVAYEVARVLHAPLDIVMVRKVGVPFQPELAMGAVGEEDVRVVNAGGSAAAVVYADTTGLTADERVELDTRARRFRAGRPRAVLAGKTAIVVDDGVATGSTARAACRAARSRGANRIVLAAPVASPSVVAALTDVADEIVCIETPSPLFSVGEWYHTTSPRPATPR